MTRSSSRPRPALVLSFAIALGGCGGGGDLPTVPPPPKEGTVKEAASEPGVVKKETIKTGRTTKTVAPPNAN